MRWWLQWAAIPYGFASRLRARLYHSGWMPSRTLPVFVVSVGNLTVGGTGKTPVVICLAQWLCQAGKRVAILSRGYRRVGGEDQLLVSDGGKVLVSADEAGDEPFLMASRCPGVVVAVGADRHALGRWVLDRFSVDCILLDDGFQHLGLRRDVDLLLVDATDAEGLRAVVPAGRLREPIQAAARASMVVVTRADKAGDGEIVLSYLERALGSRPVSATVVFRAQTLVSVSTGALEPTEWCRGKTAVLCSGIGHAASFRDVATSLGLRILGEKVYRDHHRYTRDDIRSVCAAASASGAELVVTTEKDAGKLRPLLDLTDSNWWAVRLDSVVTSGEGELRRLVFEGSTRKKGARV